MKATVKIWGNSAAVRILAAVMQATNMDLDEVVDVRAEAGRIVIEPVRQKTYDIDELLKGITSKNRHKAVDFGPPRGQRGLVIVPRYVPMPVTWYGSASHRKLDTNRPDIGRPLCSAQPPTTRRPA